MTHQEIRQKFLNFFKEQGHAIVPSSSLVSEEDITTLFTGSGMQPLLPYLLGKPHPAGTKIANSQKSFRAEDIEEVGDNRHTTFFEMLGNWSFGEYWKEDQLSWFFEFLTKTVGLQPERLYVSVFSGERGIEKDKDSIAIWQKLFASKNIPALYAQMDSIEEGAGRGMKPDERIFGYGVQKNWWSRSGSPDQMPVGEPGGPDSEVFYDFGTPHDEKYGKYCHPNCDCGRYLEIGNSVFMEFRKKANGDLEKLLQRNVDFGGGLERITAASENQPDIFLTSPFKKIIAAVQEVISNRLPEENYANDKNRRRTYRIIADHIKAAAFLIADGVTPSNKLRGYVLRRLIRRAIRYARLPGISVARPFLAGIAKVVIEMYGEAYPELTAKKESILIQITQEEEGFGKTVAAGLKEVGKQRVLDGTIAFNLYQTYGFPFELTEEIARERGQSVVYGEFRGEFEKHQEKSRASAKKKFGGHGLLLDTGELKAANEEEIKIVTRLHTATHLLHAALRQVLGLDVKQAGSDITAERLRFDFTFPRKLTPEEIRRVEDLVNDIVYRNIEVKKKEMLYEEAMKTGASSFFKLKYPPRVNVYSVGDFSKELCGGPHVNRTGEIGKFKIKKEEAVSAGFRRIRAIVE